MEVNIKNDGILDIATGMKASSKVWKNVKIKWSDLVKKLSSPVVTNETFSQFMAANKSEQSAIKDVGGFVGGFLKNGKRDKSSVLHRQLVTLDIDFSHDNFWWDFTMLFGCAAVIHSTHKSSPKAPRHRLIIPLDRSVSYEEYMAISRRIAGDLNIGLFDQSTFDVNRLMFWPSVSSDAEYYFEFQDGPFLCADNVLSTYNDWRDISEWPSASTEREAVFRDVKKQEDPTAKKGIVGLFCRAYLVRDAISKFLPEVYTENDNGRYSYANGTTSGGLVIYDDKFAYSHHGTDPAGGRLCNAFDLVRIHKFGHLDSGLEKNEENRKSFKAMEQLAASDDRVLRQIALEQLEKARAEFGGEKFSEDEFDTSWTSELTANTKGVYDNSASNLNTILRNDKYLKSCFALNTFDNKRYIMHSLPWREVDEPEVLREVDYSGVRNYIECVYGIVASQKVDDALALEFEKNQFNPVKEYITSLEWDGKERIDTLLIDYFGADDNQYTRVSIRKMLCAAVTRIMRPGTKFDMALILVGPQATYKSTFIKKLGKNWFSDTFTTVQGKEAFEQLQGAWVIEMAELSGLKKAEVETIKHFISKSSDQYRPAYGRVIETYPRKCVFFGTTNKEDFLRDPTGNRRFLPIDVHSKNATKSVVEDLTDYEIDQIWAEAYKLYMSGETLYFSADINKMALQEQENHSESDERRGLIEEYLEKAFPDDWDEMDLFERKRWLNEPLSKSGSYIKDIVCAAEIWCECLMEDKSKLSKYNTREINEILRSLPDWEAVQSTKMFPIYGKQKYYKRK